MKIAVVGAGISGLASAWFLARRHEVTLYEKDSRVGGHTNTVEVETTGGRLPIDTGFIVCNPVNYPNFYRFLDELKVPRQNTDMSLGVSVAQGRVEWAGDENLLKVFAQPSLLASPTHWRMLSAVMRFNAHVKRLLAADTLPDCTLGEFLDTHGYPMSLRVRYVAAMAGPIWSTSTQGVMEFPFATFARFFDSHGLLNVYERPQWQTVVGGSRRYVEALLASYAGRVETDAAVTKLRRDGNAVHVTTAAGEARYDAVICATHSDQALRMLDGASEAERAVLGNVPYAHNTAWLHTDARLMPKRRRAWSAWNALLATDALGNEPIAVSYWMNRLQNLPGPVDYIVSLNPPQAPAPETVLYRTDYEHPVYRTATVRAQDALGAIQPRPGMAGSIAWAGAWTGYGFHEDGFKSGLRAVAAIDPACVPGWAQLGSHAAAAPVAGTAEPALA